MIEDNTPYSLRKIADDLGAIDLERLYSAAAEIERLRKLVALRSDLADGLEADLAKAMELGRQAEQRGAEHEREECANIVEAWEPLRTRDSWVAASLYFLAAAIRARTATDSVTVTLPPHTQDPNED